MLEARGSSQVSLSSFSPISRCDLKDIVHSAKPSSSPTDTVPARLLGQVIDTIGPALLDLINSSLTTGCALDHFKLAVV